jgi:hypothetical protein
MFSSHQQHEQKKTSQMLSSEQNVQVCDATKLILRLRSGQHYSRVHYFFSFSPGNFISGNKAATSISSDAGMRI